MTRFWKGVENGHFAKAIGGQNGQNWTVFGSNLQSATRKN